MWRKRTVLVAGFIAILLGLLAFHQARPNPAPVVQGSSGANGQASSPRRASLPSANPPRASGQAAQADDTLDRQDDCENLCGARCVADSSGKLRCPKTCSSDGECESNEICTASRMAVGGQRSFRCLKSECSGIGADADCGKGMTCLSEAHSQTRVRYYCEATGDRKAGEHCAYMDYAAVGTCGAGLMCLRGVCEPTSCMGDSDCPKGTRCSSMVGRGGSGCTPHCDSDADCPEPERCVRFLRGSGCGVVAADSCLLRGCEPGKHCYTHINMTWGLLASCVTPCSESNPCSGRDEFCAPSEGENELAIPFHCYTRCDPASTNRCADGMVCGPLQDGRFRCMASEGKATDDYFHRTFESKSARKDLN